MKFLASIILALSSLSFTAPAIATGEMKKVCVDVKDKAGKPVKDAKGNVKQNCKEVKVHKKLEGTQVPVKK
jgi:hypothetical protein